jgi:ferrous-iron efflux pump FieF
VLTSPPINTAEDLHAKAQAMRFGLFSTLVGGALTLSAGISSGSLVLYADALRMASDALAIFASLTALKKVAKGGAEYEYGLGKLENLTSVLVALVMLVSFCIIFTSALYKFQHPSHVGHGGLMFGLVVKSCFIAIFGGLWYKSKHMAAKRPSPLMESQWRLYRTKTVATAAVFFALLVGLLGSADRWVVYVDPLGSIMVAGFLFVSAFGVLSMSTHDLLDRTLEESLQVRILAALAEHFDLYKHLHGIRSRRSGGDVYIELFLEFEPTLVMGQVQENIDRIRDGVGVRIPGCRVLVAPCTRRLE